MTKVRTPYTPEYAMKRAMKLVPLVDIAEHVERSEKTVYKWSDHEEDTPLPFWAAIRIDALCLERVGEAPFSDMMKKMAEATPGARRGPIGIKDATLEGQFALGNLSSLVIAAISEDGPGGARITAIEGQSLLVAAEKMRQQLNMIENAITQAGKAG